MFVYIYVYMCIYICVLLCIYMHIQEAPKRPVVCRFGGCFISVFGIVWEPLNYQVKG